MSDQDNGSRAVALTRLQRKIATCDQCVTAGFIPVANPIFKGSIGNRVMVVGQAPGALTHQRSLPYSGATGRTLRGWLVQAGFDSDALYQRFYLTSVTKCFPGTSASGKGDRAPTAREIALCSAHLDREIAVIQPELILALGRLSIVALCGPATRSAPLAALVGTLRDAERAGHRFRVLPLPHPSGLSRWLNDPANKERHARALTLLAAEREGRGL